MALVSRATSVPSYFGAVSLFMAGLKLLVKVLDLPGGKVSRT